MELKDWVQTLTAVILLINEILRLRMTSRKRKRKGTKSKRARKQ